jgi:hypothetical protein
MNKNQNLDNCNHRSLSFFSDYGDPTPIRCESCPKLFSLKEAITHVRPPGPVLKHRYGKDVLTLEEAQATGVAHITMGYSAALKDHLRTRRVWLAFPDFNIKVGGANLEVTKKNAYEQLTGLLSLNFYAGLQPPIPQPVEVLKKQHPDLAKWEWIIAYIDVTHLLLMPETPDNQLSLPI